MNKLLLTSAGFNSNKIIETVKELLDDDMKNMKVLFITTAAVTEEQKKILPLCKNEILELGILDRHIDTYDFEYPLNDSIKKYDLIYVAGGSTKHLLEKFKTWKDTLDLFLDDGGLYIGVSAGSIVMTTTHPEGLNYLDCKMKVHQKTGDLHFESGERLSLTDDQAVLILNEKVTIIT